MKNLKIWHVLTMIPLVTLPCSTIIAYAGWKLEQAGDTGWSMAIMLCGICIAVVLNFSYLATMCWISADLKEKK